MKKLILVSVVLFSIHCIGQGDTVASEKTQTKMEAFVSQTGVITKFTDFNLNKLKSNYTAAEIRIRKVSSGNVEKYFYQIEKTGKYGSSTASIEHSDLLELIKALNSLKSELNNDLTGNPDYLENKFVTDDGFQLGYFIRKGKSTWYIKLEKYGSDNNIFINDVSTIELNLNEAKAKIEELKKLI